MAFKSTTLDIDGNRIEAASYEDSSSGVTASLADPTRNAGDAVGDIYANIEDASIEGLVGSNGDDPLIGDGQANALQGGDGNDTLEGAIGTDTLDGGNGNDFASYANAKEAVIADILAGGLAGEAEGDVYTSIEGLIGSRFNDTLYGAGLGNSLEGGEGADELNGGDGIDFASYAHATTDITASLTDSSINTGEAAGDKYLRITGLIGSSYDDLLVGDSNPNTLLGGAGNDTLEGYGGDDSLDGGDGIDVASYAHAENGVSVALGSNGLTEIEALIGSSKDDVLTGDANNNTLEGGAGKDQLNGGGGTDFASYAHATSGVTASLATASGSKGDAAGDTYKDIEGLIGSSSADLLIGDDANNTLQGGKGDDTLQGGKNDDILEGGAGADELNGGDGIDFASYANATGGVIASLATASGSKGDAAGDTYYFIEGLIGSSSADQLIGDDADNILQGGKGDDTLEGGAGADELNGGDGIDFASYAAATESVVADLADTSQNSGDAEGDSYDFIEGLIGSAQGDLLYGDDGANKLLGGDGDDRLWGRKGDDTLKGGAGNDTLRGEAGNKTLVGGADDDIIVIEQGDNTVIWREGDGNDQIYLNASGANLKLDLQGWEGGPVLDGATSGNWTMAVTRSNANDINSVTFTRNDGNDGNDGNGGSVVVRDWSLGTNSVICILPGTRITTPDGHRPIETLTPGDIVTTPDGPRPVRWVGRSRYSMVFLRGKPMCLPVRIHAGALGQGLPARDLWVSPWHALLIGQTLVRAFDLINGQNVTQDYQGQIASFYNVELDSPDIIFAEGTPVETYANHNNRAMFHNLDEYLALYGSHEPSWMRADGTGIRRHPLLDENAPELAPIRQAVLARALNQAA